MSEMRRNFLVGLFMVVGLGALGYLLVLFGEAPSWLGRAEWVLRIRLEEIYGIEAGTPIYLNGIKVGRVTGLEFVDMHAPDKGIEVIGQIRSEFSVPTGAEAQCIGPAMGIGRGRIDIFAHGAGRGIEPGGTIPGVTVNPLDKILPESLIASVEGTLVSVGDFAEMLTPVAKDLHELLKKTPIPEQGDAEAAAAFTANLHTVIQRFDRALASLDTIIGDPKLKNGLLEAVENIRAMSVDGRAAFADARDISANLKTDAARIADKAESSIDHLDREMTRLADAAMPILDDSARTAANLRLLSSNLVEGRGTLGMLLADERLYEVMVLSLDRARDMIDSLRRLAYRFEKTGKIGLSMGGVPFDQKLPPK